ncbi:SIS domain-containing protein [bacterium]|nr:SIS domain-containing protein [bacterium]
MISIIKGIMDDAARALEAVRADDATLAAIARAAGIMVASLQEGGTLFSCGNGGSMCDAMHFAEELSGRYRKDRPAVRAISISDPSHISCVGNDYGYEFVFSRFLEAHGREGDVLLAISTSGTSKNVKRAVEAARDRGMKVVALTGRPGSVIGGLADVDICTPGGAYADRVQEMHIKVIHTFMELIERELFPGLYR